MSLIEIKDLSHIFSYETEEGTVEEVALDKINLNINRGEFVALVGMNGSGKSTLAKHMNGLLLPTSGSCTVDGILVEESEKLWQVRQKVSMVFQNPDNQIIAAIVEDDIAFGPENLGVDPKEIRQRINEALHWLNIDHLKYLAPHLLSGGQKQLVAIAGALAMRTDCIVLDEPTAMLDPQGRQLVMDAILKLNKEFGLTIVLITHFMEEALLADRMVVMDQGRIVATGAPKDLFTQVELLQCLGLTIPLAMDFAHQFNKAGFYLGDKITKQEELVVAIKNYLQGGKFNAHTIK